TPRSLHRTVGLSRLPRRTSQCRHLRLDDRSCSARGDSRGSLACTQHDALRHGSDPEVREAAGLVSKEEPVNSTPPALAGGALSFARLGCLALCPQHRKALAYGPRLSGKG